MTQEFDHVRVAFAESVAGRWWSGTNRAFASAWRSSSFASAMRQLVLEFPTGARRVRTIAIAVAIAAGLQPLLMVMMGRTVRPSLPLGVFVVIAVAAAAAGLRPASIATAWPQSRLARAWRR